MTKRKINKNDKQDLPKQRSEAGYPYLYLGSIPNPGFNHNRLPYQAGLPVLIKNDTAVVGIIVIGHPGMIPDVTTKLLIKAGYNGTFRFLLSDQMSEAEKQMAAMSLKAVKDPMLDLTTSLSTLGKGSIGNI